MIELKVKALKWGNSFGFRLRKEDIKRTRIALGRDIRILVPDGKIVTGEKVFGSLPNWNEPIDKIMKEIDEGWHNKLLEKRVRDKRA